MGHLQSPGLPSFPLCVLLYFPPMMDAFFLTWLDINFSSGMPLYPAHLGILKLLCTFAFGYHCAPHSPCLISSTMSFFWGKCPVVIIFFLTLFYGVIFWYLSVNWYNEYPVRRPPFVIFLFRKWSIMFWDYFAMAMKLLHSGLLSQLTFIIKIKWEDQNCIYYFTGLPTWAPWRKSEIKSERISLSCS